MNGIASAQSSPGLVLLGFAVLVAVRFFYYDRSEEPEDVLHLAMNVVGRTMIAIGVVEGCLFMLGWFTMPLAVGAAVVALIVHWRYRSSRRAALLAAMASAASTSMPLAPAVEAFAAEWRGSFRRCARLLARSLADGTPLPEALRRTRVPISLVDVILAILLLGPVGLVLIGLLVILIYWIGPRGIISPKSLSVIEAGQEAGVLSEAIGEAARLALPQESLTKAALPIWYLLDMLLVAGGVVTFLLVKIVPAFIKIFQDFDAELPPATIALIQFFDYFVNYFYIALPLVLLLLASGIHFALRYFGLSRWDPPLIAGVARRLDTAVVLRMLGVVAAAGRPLEPALAAFARGFPNASLRRRLRRVREDVSCGADCWESFREHGLLRLQETALLKSASRVGNLPWVLGETAAGIERKFTYRMRVVSQFLLPAAVLTFGAVVFSIVVGLFLPLVSLIEKLL